LQEAEKAIADSQARIPVLVELRYLPSEANELAVGDRIRAFMSKHDPALRLDVAAVENLLRQGRLLLLVDGVNELPQSHRVNVFREQYQKACPMIFTTRDSRLGGDLGITNLLEMQPLSETQMKNFVVKYIPNQAEAFLRQLSGKLPELSKTPLFLWMLCDLFKVEENIPQNLGDVFRKFTKAYLEKSIRKHEVAPFKGDVQPLSDQRLWLPALKHLAFTMMSGKSIVDFRVVINRDEIEQEFKNLFLDEPYPTKLARDCLDDLLKYHLIQSSNDQIEFRHQLIQEYYAAEWLLGRLPSLSDVRLQHDYLNYLKWTEPLALMLELVESEEQAVRVVRLTLEVDLSLGARLAGAVKIEFKSKTIRLLLEQPLPESPVIYLLGLTRSEQAILYLENKLDLQNSSICQEIIKALGKIPTQTTVDILTKLINDTENNSMIHGEIAVVLGETRIPSAIALLEDWNKREEEKEEEIGYLKIRIETALWDIHGDERKPDLFKQFIADYGDQDFEREYGEISLDNLLKAINDKFQYYDGFEDFAAKKIANYKDKQVIPKLEKLVFTGRYNSRDLAVRILGTRSSSDIMPILIKSLDDENPFVRKSAVYGLAKFGSKVLDPLLKALYDEYSHVREAAICSLGKIGGDKSLAVLTMLFQQNHKSLYDIGDIVKAIGDIGREESIDLLISRFEKKDYSLSNNIVEALGNIGGDKAVGILIQILENDEFGVKENVVQALRKIAEIDRNLPTLTRQLPHLLTLVPTEASQQALSVITTIQSRCKYYNYDISQMTLPPEDKANSTTGNTFIFHEKVAQVIAGDLIVHGDNSAT